MNNPCVIIEFGRHKFTNRPMRIRETFADSYHEFSMGFSVDYLTRDTRESQSHWECMGIASSINQLSRIKKQCGYVSDKKE